MTIDWGEEYRAKVREFVAERGRKVEVKVKQYDWEADDETSTYGWVDDDATHHVRSVEAKYPGDGCHWVVPEGVKLYERTYSQFADTFSGNTDEVGINVRGCSCACGKYSDVILRWDGTVTEMLHAILGMPSQHTEVTL